MEIVPFESAHLARLENLGQQEEVVRPFLNVLAESRYEDQGPCFSGLVDDRVIGCAGLIEHHDYMATAWAIISKQDMAQRFVAIHRAVDEFLKRQTYRRINAHVGLYDRAGHRWARMLGFTCEILCRPYYAPDGSAISEYWRRG